MGVLQGSPNRIHADDCVPCAFRLYVRRYPTPARMCLGATRRYSGILLVCFMLPRFVGKFVLTSALRLMGYNQAGTTGDFLCTLLGLMGQFFGIGASSWNTMIGAYGVRGMVDEGRLTRRPGLLFSLRTELAAAVNLWYDVIVEVVVCVAFHLSHACCSTGA